MNARLRQLIANEATGGVVMLLAAAAALFCANLWHDNYQALVHAMLPGGINVHFAVSDILMPIFFLFVGLELKQEMLEGTLATPAQRTLPLMAALGGIIVPALIYMCVTNGMPDLQSGWAVPTATDIAFALCIVNLAGARVPVAAKIFLLAIAIYDDLAAIIIIALFYSGGVTLLPLVFAAVIVATMFALRRRSEPEFVLILGIVLGFLLHAAGIHTSVAGMITGLFMPRIHLKNAAHRLQPYVVFGILPLFAFVSAGVDLRGLSIASLLAPLPLGIAAGLFLGKPLGIFLATFATVKSGIAPMPKGMGTSMLFAIAVTAGIGFTMSLFIGQLAFDTDTMRDAVKLGVLTGSALSALLGLAFLRRATSR